MARGPPAAAVPPHDRKVSVVALHPYPRGFLIFRRDAVPTLPEGWSTVPLGNSDWVFAHDHLEVPELVQVGDSDQWVLVHGLCLYSGPDAGDHTPAQRLAAAAATGIDEFLDLLDLLGGRHVVLRGTDKEFTLYQDATGMRSVYFSPETTLVATHPHLINSCEKHRPRTEADGKRGIIASWDRTPYLGIRALLPNHSLHIPTFEADRFFPRTQNRFSAWTVDQKVNEYISIWQRQWRALQQRGDKLVFSVTGGQDSRTTMALAGEKLREHQTFTYTVDAAAETDQARTLKLDVSLISQIRRIFPLDNHTTLIKNDDLVNQAREYSSVLNKNTIRSHGSWLLPGYVQLAEDRPTIHVRGNVYGLFKAHWRTKFPTGSRNEIVSWLMTKTRIDSGHEDRPRRLAYYERGVDEWGYDKPLHDYDVSDLLYWEIRLGRWASEIYNETDLAFNSCDTANIRRLLEIALSFTDNQKETGLLQAEVVNSTTPILNFPGKNTSKNLYEQNRDSPTPSAEVPLEAAESQLELDTNTIIRANSQVICKNEAGGACIIIPAEHFIKGRSVTRSFRALPINGDIFFTLNNRYVAPHGKVPWQVQVSIGNEILLSWNGGARMRPVHVALQNIPAGANVSVSLVPSTDQQGKTSWEKASCSNITEAIFHAKHSNKPISAAADITL